MRKCIFCDNVTKECEGFSLNSKRCGSSTILELIKLHFSFSDLILKLDSSQICTLCIHELENFHKFYNKVKSKFISSVGESFIKYEELEQEEVGEEADPIEEVKENAKSSKNDIKIVRETSKNHEILPKKSYRRRTEADEKKILSSVDMKCDICKETLDSFTHALTHHREFHNQKGYLICCSRKFRQRSALVDHLDFHSDPDHFKCETCGKTFSSQSNLRTHIASLHIPQTRFQCDFCGKFANCKFRLSAHVKTHSAIKSSSKFPCLIQDCVKVFQSKSGLLSHHRICHNPKRDTFSCEVCGKQLMTRTSLKDHVENTHAESINKIQCQLCGHYIKNEYSMKKHLNRHKQMSQDITCEICGKKCTTKAALRSHLRMKHLLQRNLKCNFCEKAFKQQIDLKEHEATHTGVDLYNCLWCPATFRFGANFRAHRKSVHPEEYEKIKPTWLRPN